MFTSKANLELKKLELYLQHGYTQVLVPRRKVAFTHNDNKIQVYTIDEILWILPETPHTPTTK